MVFLMDVSGAQNFYPDLEPDVKQHLLVSEVMIDGKFRSLLTMLEAFRGLLVLDDHPN